MSEHVIDSSEPYHPEKLKKKDYVGAAAYFELDLRSGIILKVEEFPEMRKPSYKIEVISVLLLVGFGARPRLLTILEQSWSDDV